MYKNRPLNLTVILYVITKSFVSLDMKYEYNLVYTQLIKSKKK